MPIKITSADARKAKVRPEEIQKPEKISVPVTSEFHYLLRLNVITLVEDCFIQYMGVKKLSECETEWNKFKKILERKL